MKNMKKQTNNLLHPWNVAGWYDAEGTFGLIFEKDPTRPLGWSITQHLRDRWLMECLKNHFKVGNVYHDRNTYVYKVTNVKDISQVMIPFFSQYPITGTKNKDFKDLCKAANIINHSEHLTPKGKEDLLNIKKGMNTGRKLRSFLK